MPNLKVKFFYLFAAIALLLGIVYFFNDPAASAWFPKCPFLVVTGYQCPGCGSQRAVHALLHFQVKDAIAHNPLLVAAIPYLAAGAVFNIRTVKESFPETRRFLFGQKAIFVVLTIVLLFWLLRNIL